MALKALMLRRKLDEARAQLGKLTEKAEELNIRETQLEQAIAQAQSPDEQKAVEEEITQFDTERTENAAEQERLSAQICELEKELAQTEKKSAPAEEREVNNAMNTRTGLCGMTVRESETFLAREDVKGYLDRVRSCIRERRSIENAALTIPEVMLPLLKSKIEQSSKLLSRVSLSGVSGTGRQIIQGTIPEAVWTEMCASLNELSFGFNEIEIDGYKIGGFYELCNAVIEDSDLDLASEIINSLGKSIAKGVDKAIVYGVGTKMPLGVVTRLAQTAKPSDYPATAREWKNLSSSNIMKLDGASGISLFKKLTEATACLINDYFEDGLVWIMNKKTHIKLISESMDKNMNAAIVSGIGTTMPVVGGDIIELPFVPDDNIVFGYFEAFRMVERAGARFASSEHIRFIEDRTVFKGTARYDGKPAIAEAFGLISLTSSAPATSVSFPQDAANTVASSTDGDD